ncbi:short-chain type dehydrogenase/reductase-like protein [Trifolium pratense]|uniref:Short-chain type dehydrogenase/reductase-like protein n=1 Tax=Trifolium pratense TaxID=57577 RepID=A0A2K3MRC5_TRIPR|nr:short-chain type dehydrogenase/reductase-like protein [Trifolium pratense]
MATSLPLQDRVAIVTGSSRGIGKGIAIHLASLGAKLVINYTSNSNLADLVAEEINANQPTLRAITVQADISDPAAGVIAYDSPTIANITVENFDRIMNVNARGAFLCGKESANRLKRGGGGRIIFLSTSLVAALESQVRARTLRRRQEWKR